MKRSLTKLDESLLTLVSGGVYFPSTSKLPPIPKPKPKI